MGSIKLSDHFTLEELTFSQTAGRKNIDNKPSLEKVAHLTRLAYCMEQVRALLGAQAGFFLGLARIGCSA